ncbi:phage major capsid protein, partial [Pseudorhodoplanes sp.]|uniref:phage major capsid protein n=1 Tax=Pseudorhodoplanes sp. TaxID=1934341 RepID=UPI00391A4CE2
SIAFGNFKAGYLIAERAETQILRDPFTNKPFVHYATRRVGGQVMNSEAMARSTATLSGGIAGHVYSLVNRITLSDERVDERSITLRVEDR